MLGLSQLASRFAAERARAADRLLREFAPDKPHRGGLSRDFGSDPEAVFSPLFPKLCELIGYPVSKAWTKFRQSMSIGFDQWHDGIGYDLDALSAMPEEERAIIGQVMRNRLTDTTRVPEWRDMETAAALGDTGTLERLLGHGDAEVRLRAGRYVGSGDETEAILCQALVGPDPSAASKALDDVCDHPVDKVRQAVVTLLRRMDENFIYAGFIALQVFGGVEDAWAERPFLFAVQEQGPDGPLMEQLLARLSPGS